MACALKFSSETTGVGHRLQGLVRRIMPANGGTAPRRIIIWFRNDLRLRDNVIVHQAVQKLQAEEYDEVGNHPTSSMSAR